MSRLQDMAVRLAICALAVGVCGCASSRHSLRGDAEFAVPAIAMEFSPATFVSAIHLERGPYGGLYAPDSYAVWVGADVAALKRAHAAESGETIEPELEMLSNVFNDNFLIFECHLASAFADMSIGYDSVGLRNVDIYLMTADGRVVRPVQTLMAGPLKETQQGAIRRFERANLVIFPKKSLTTGISTVPGNAPAVRLVIEAVRTQFYFEWESALFPALPPGPPTFDDRVRAVRLGFNEFYRKLAAAGQMFH